MINFHKLKLLLCNKKTMTIVIVMRKIKNLILIEQVSLQNNKIKMTIFFSNKISNKKIPQILIKRKKKNQKIQIKFKTKIKVKLLKNNNNNLYNNKN